MKRVCALDKEHPTELNSDWSIAAFIPAGYTGTGEEAGLFLLFTNDVLTLERGKQFISMIMCVYMCVSVCECEKTK